MALVARTYRDPLSTEEGGSVMLGIENRTPTGVRSRGIYRHDKLPLLPILTVLTMNFPPGRWITALDMRLNPKLTHELNFPTDFHSVRSGWYDFRPGRMRAGLEFVEANEATVLEPCSYG